MNKLKKRIITGAAVACALLSLGATVAPAEEQPAPAGEQPESAVPAPVSMLGMAAGSLTANPNPISLDLGPLGPVSVTGVVSGLGLWQNNKFPDQQHSQASLSNGQVFLQKNDGLFQYFLQVGAYTLPALGSPYFSTATTTGDFFGPVPVAFAKIAPTDEFSIMAGKLPTLIGAEYTFTFENMNIQRGLLWNQENAVNRGVQVNYTLGPLALSSSWNDGFYSNRYTWLWGSAAYTLDKENTLALIGSGNTTRTNISTTATPLFLNNEQLYNLIYTHTAGQWTFQPYLQYTHVPQTPEIGATQDASTYGAALLMNYAFPSDAQIGGLKLAGVSLPVRFEYIASTGNAATGAPNLMYGPGSKAWSITVTPTYQYNVFFARAELSYV